jgi:hypothetical protein
MSDEHEKLCRAVAKSWGMDPDIRDFDGTDRGVIAPLWRNEKVQNFVKAFVACRDAGKLIAVALLVLLAGCGNTPGQRAADGLATVLTFLTP